MPLYFQILLLVIVVVFQSQRVDIPGRMDRTSPTSGERSPDDPMDTLPLQDTHVLVKNQDDTPSDTDVSTISDVILPIDSIRDLHQQVHETIIPGVGMVSSLSSRHSRFSYFFIF
jgi:hypothetical protein